MPSIDEDIDLIVGGHFSPDSLSPEVYEATLARARARSEESLRAFAARFTGLNFDAPAQSTLYLPSFLQYLRPVQPDTVIRIAAYLGRMYSSALLVYDAAPDKKALLATVPEETTRVIQRLVARRAELAELVQSAQ